jgi:hypothetical protein
MPSAAFYRKEAERYCALAAASLDSDAQAHWLRMSKDHNTLADALAADEQHPQDVGCHEADTERYTRPTR